MRAMRCLAWAGLAVCVGLFVQGCGDPSELPTQAPNVVPDRNNGDGANNADDNNADDNNADDNSVQGNNGADNNANNPGNNSSNNPDNNSNNGDNNAQDNSANNGGDNSGSPLSGGAIYQQQCASCHGDFGEGGSGPGLQRWARGRDALVQVVEARMPLGDPTACEGACAERVSDFILRWFGEAEPVDCAQEPVGVRQLRLLTRREYRNTVRELFGWGQGGGSCEALSDCAWTRETCAAGRCEADACGVHAFVFRPGARRPRTVHVAGSFNGWAATLAGGGWAMQYEPSVDAWIARRPLQEGSRHTYKFVVDEAEWLLDADNPQRESDGFGGQNSVLTVTCDEGSGPDLEGLTRDLPPETRPTHFSFDNHADSARVTTVHAEEYLGIAEALAGEVVGEPGFVGCAPSEACAREFVGRFGQKAFRRPLTGAEVDRYAALVMAQPEFLDGVEVAVRVMLVSPHFLYRSELGEAQPDGSFRLTGYEVASALSYLYWAGPPDEALLEAARRGELDGAEGIEAQARRLLADPRAREVVGEFSLQWLGVEHLAQVPKQAGVYDHFDAEVREGMLDETRALMQEAVFAREGSFEHLFTAPVTTVTPALARFYGLPAPDAQGRVAYPDRQRAGFLGHGSVLASYAHSDQSSPIKRGLFVRDRLLCQVFGTPPANAGGVPDVDPTATTRERFRQHTDDPTCYGCHQYIDDVGFGFERFDAVGQLRETENGQPIDSLGNMNDVEGLGTGTDAPFEDLEALGEVLASSPTAQRCFTTQVYRFATGKFEGAQDTCALDRLQRRFEGAGLDIRELLLGVALTPEFTTRR